MRAVVMFSGGAASWAAARRTMEAGYDDVALLFTDTHTEDEDLYRFLDEAAADVGAPLERISDGRDIWQVFRDERSLGNSRADPCSKILKRELSRKWLEANRDPADTVMVLGFDWTEMHRFERAAAAWAPWQVDAPMTRPPYRMKAEMLADLQARGIAPPRLYGMGFEHNNCGGGCVKAGIGHFTRLLQVFPSRYAEWEANEEGIRQFLDKDVSILRRQGERMTLRDLRLRLQSGWNDQTVLWDVGGCACFEEPEPEDAS